ncbi:MAG: hypothetical protein BWY07_01985 [Candidatus Hydrogenedentes bacterium ADurb.Bin170]|nr:MAG: hypothetical protein BWY07_01985 [Candidatus Hydrogenedentes bacterium ADurb.Bin170]
MLSGLSSEPYAFNFCGYDRDEAAGMGFLPAGAAAGAAGAGAAATAGISLAIAAIGSVASGLIQGASQRKRDEIASGVWLKQSVEAIEELELQVREQNITKAQAEQYFKQILNKFESAIVTLATKSVVQSRIDNQSKDLRNLFNAKMAALPDVAACPSGQARYPASKKCVPLQCPQGTYRNTETGECIQMQSQAPAPGQQTAPVYNDLPIDEDSNSSGLLWLFAAAGLAIFLLRR